MPAETQSLHFKGATVVGAGANSHLVPEYPEMKIVSHSVPHFRIVASEMGYNSLLFLRKSFKSLLSIKKG